MTVREIHTKGNLGGGDWYVTKFVLFYTPDGNSWAEHPQKFAGNVDVDTLCRNVIEPPIAAAAIRIHPVEWHEAIVLRVELLGHPFVSSGAAGRPQGAEALGERFEAPPRPLRPATPATPENEEEEEEGAPVVPSELPTPFFEDYSIDVMLCIKHILT